MKETILLVYCTTSGKEEAKKIAHTIIEKNLAACCNILPNAISIYNWQGKTEQTEESLILIKTTQRKYEQLEKEIKMIHSYSVPEIIATKIETGSSAYIDWIIDNLSRKG